MGLLDTSLLWVAGALTVLTGLAAVVLMPRLRRGAWGLLGRVGLLLLAQAVLLATVGIAVNQDFGFYASWADLAGQTGTAVVTQRGASAQAATSARVGAWTSSSTGGFGGARLVPGRRVQTLTVHGPSSGLTAQVLVVLPADYWTSHRAHPVIEALHGIPGQPASWVGSMQLPGMLDSVVAQHRLAEAVVVAPQINIPLSNDSECLDRPGNKVATWLARDVPAWAAHTLEVAKDRSAWATLGYSEGGWCAAVTAYKHPEVFSAAIVLAGYFRPDYTSMASPSSALGRADDLDVLAGRRPVPVAFFVESGPGDHLSYATSTAFIRTAKAPLSVRSVVHPGLGHRFEAWRSVLPEALGWLGQSAAGFRP